MARAEDLSTEVRRVIADGIAPYIKLAFGAERVTIGESFALWSFEGVVDDPDLVFDSRVSFHHSYHHQLFVGDQAVGLAQSRHDPEKNTWKVTRVARSLLASYVDRAIGELDELVPDDIPVVLLKASVYHLSAFWLATEGGAQLYVVSTSPFLRSVPRRRLITPKQFVAGLAQDRSLLVRLPRQEQEPEQPEEPIDL
jgi:hypothetical protein